LYQIRSSANLLKKPLGLIIDDLTKKFYQNYSVYFFIQNAFIIYTLRVEQSDFMSYVYMFLFSGSQAALFQLLATYGSLFNYVLLRAYISPAINKIIYTCFGLKVKSQVKLNTESTLGGWMIIVYQSSNGKEITIDVDEQSKPLSKFKVSRKKKWI